LLKNFFLSKTTFLLNSLIKILQNKEETATCVQEYIKVAQHEFADPKGSTKHSSDVLLTVGNWRFVQAYNKAIVKRRCTPDDFYVGLKLASTIFKPKNLQAQRELPYFFDQNGMQMPLKAFSHFLNDPSLTEDFFAEIKTKFASDSEKNRDLLAATNTEELEDLGSFIDCEVHLNQDSPEAHGSQHQKRPASPNETKGSRGTRKKH